MRCLACVIVLVGVLLGSIPQPAGAEGLESPLRESAVVAPAPAPPGLGYSLTPSTTEPYTACPPGKGKIQCDLIIDPHPVETLSGAWERPNNGPMLEGSGELGGFDPKDLQSAYKIPTSEGSTQTVAVIDAYGDPNLESDLAKYREKYELPECKKENTKKEVTNCFRKVNEKGEEANYPAENSGTRWALETALDVDMVSAACPGCHILVVEASGELAKETAASVEEAVKLGATEISNSYGYEETDAEWCPHEKGCSEYLAAYNHSGIPITVSSGDSGFDDSFAGDRTTNWPASSPNVIAVGGTELKKAENARGWTETVWHDSGSGCTVYESKPTWQTDLGCAHRMDNDVAAVAEGVSVYSTAEKRTGWINVGGTSVGSPLVAGIEAHASSAVKTEGAEAFYRSQLFDVTTGNDGYCDETYFCDAEEGYDGPSGWGSPDGPPEVAAGYHAVTEPATNVTATGATLNGYVNPEGSETTYHFEYGPTTSYGTNLPVPNASVGAGKVWKAVSQTITGGLWGTYHYRLAATRGSETIYGVDHIVTTTPWTVQESPDEGPNENVLEGVSCGSSESCTAVASYQSSSGQTRWPLAENWNGYEWNLNTTATPTGATYAVFYGVGCSSGNACTGVGEYVNSSKVVVPLAERWNGTAWSVQTAPAPEGAKESYLAGAACSSSTACTAVGQYTNSSGAKVPLAERWNGTAWSVQTTPTPEGGKEIALYGVSCSSTTTCTATGHYTNSSKVVVPLAESWNGTAWSVQSVPSPTGAKASYLYGVSCSSSNVCTGAGQYTNSSEAVVPLAERWNGTAWSVQTTPGPAGSRLRGVSCSTATACMATGSGGPHGTLAESWNGTEWAILETPNAEEIGSYQFARLSGVSCTSATACTTVGEGNKCGTVCSEVTLAERYAPPVPVLETNAATGVVAGGATLNGTVNPESQATTYHFEYGKTTSYGTSVPIPSGNAGYGTSAVKESNAITNLEPSTTYHFRVVATSVLGNVYGADKSFTTASASWRITSTPNPGGSGYYDYLWGVSCISSTACTAVGEYYHSGSGENSLAEVWNGTEWSVQSTPNVSGAKETTLYKVSCGSASSCMAVGYYRNTAGTYYVVIEHWNGSEWAIQTAPEPTGTLNSLLEGVACSSATACTAVGYYENSSGVTLPLAERWNGTEWSIQTTPSPSGATESEPLSVSCATSTACTLVGYYGNSEKVKVLLAESWNGTEWTVQTVPNPSGSTKAQARGVSCTSSTACTMVGEYKNSAGTEVTLAERWNGTEWKIQTTPNPTEAKNSYLNGGVSCKSSTQCTTVGVSVTSSGKPVTLAEHWNGTEWTIQSTPNGENGEGWLAGGVSCSGTASCAAVGSAIGSTGSNITLAEMYG